MNKVIPGENSMTRKRKIFLFLLILLVVIAVVLITTAKGCNLGQQKAKTSIYNPEVRNHLLISLISLECETDTRIIPVNTRANPAA